MRTTLLFLALASLLDFACSGNDYKRAGAVFRSATGELKLSGATTLEAPLELVRSFEPDLSVASYFGPIERSRKQFLEVTLRATGTDVTLSLLSEFDGPGKYTAFQPEGTASLHLFLGKDCQGGNGNIFSNDCLWYGSAFDSGNCVLTIESVSAASLSGRLECTGLGANCYETGQRDASGHCIGGKEKA